MVRGRTHGSTISDRKGSTARFAAYRDGASSPQSGQERAIENALSPEARPHLGGCCDLGSLGRQRLLIVHPMLRPSEVDISTRDERRDRSSYRRRETTA